jgi:hypothetical protein
MRSRRQLGVLIAGLAIAVVATSLAVAAVRERSASTTLTATEPFGTVTAKCKRGRRAVAGGFEGTAYIQNVQPQLLAVDSAPAGKRKWTSAGRFYYDAGVQSGEFFSYAYCDDSGPRLKKRSASTAVGVTGTPEAIGTVTARCKRGSEAVSGGFDATDHTGELFSPEIYVLSSRRQGKRKWTVSAFNFGDAPGELTAFAYCDRSEPRLKAKSVITTVGTYPDTSFITARCEKGRKIVSGGFDSPEFDPSGTESEMYPFVSARKANRGWTVAGFNESTSRSLNLVAYAYCERK